MDAKSPFRKLIISNRRRVSTSFDGRVRTALYLVLAGENGERLWESTYPMAGRDCSIGSFIQTGDGGYAVVGTVGDYLRRNAYLARFNPAKEVEWEQEYPGSKNSFGTDLIQDADGGFVLAGRMGNHGFLMKTDEMGKEVWRTKLAAEQEGSHAAQVLFAPGDGDGNGDGGGNGEGNGEGNGDGNGNGDGYMVVGSFLNAGDTFWEIYLACLCSEGTIEWEKHYGGDREERGYSAALPADERLVITGYSRSDVGLYRAVYLLRVDKEREMLWEEKYVTPAYDSTGIGVLQAADEKFVLLANAETPYSAHRVALLILADSRGKVEDVRRLWVGGEVRAGPMNPAGEDTLLITGMASKQEEREYGDSSMFLMKATHKVMLK